MEIIIGLCQNSNIWQKLTNINVISAVTFGRVASWSTDSVKVADYIPSFRVTSRRNSIYRLLVNGNIDYLSIM